MSSTPDGPGGLFTSGSNAPLLTSIFLDGEKPINEQEVCESRSTHVRGIDWLNVQFSGIRILLLGLGLG